MKNEELEKDPKGYVKKIINRMKRKKDEKQYGKMSDDKYEKLKDSRAEFKAMEERRMRMGSSDKKKKPLRLPVSSPMMAP